MAPHSEAGVPGLAAEAGGGECCLRCDLPAVSYAHGHTGRRGVLGLWT